jgi:hypothetical protein
MAYQEITGIASPEALIDAICTFVSAEGWTVERNALVGSNRTATVRMVGTTDYIHIYNVNTTEVYMRISVGYDGGLAPSANPNVQAYDTRTNGLTGPYSRVYFFMDNDAVHIVIATASAEEYRHLCFGMPDKIGDYTGGTYADGTYRVADFLGDLQANRHRAPFVGGGLGPTSNSAPYPGCIHADVVADARSNFFHWFGDRQDDHVTIGGAFTGIMSWAQAGSRYWLAYIAGGADRNIFSGRSIFHPIHVFVNRAGSPTYRSPVATIRNTRFCNLTKLSVAQEVTIGSDTWKVFPLIKRSLLASSGAAAPNYGSHTTGYAIKKIA